MKNKAKIQIAARRAARQVLKLLWVLPVKRNRILFQAYEEAGAYTCNPKYLCEYLKQFGSRYELVWVSAKGGDFSGVKGIRTVRKNSAAFFAAELTAGVIITNVAPRIYLPYRRSQLVINTWHAGGAYKRVGGVPGDEESFAWWRARQVEKQIGLYLSSSALFTKYNIREAYGYRGEILKSGMPRNDLFFDEERCRAAAEKVRKLFGAEGDELLVLYAPTFRGRKEKAEALSQPLPFGTVQRGLKERFGREVKLLVRAHHHDRNGLPGGEDVLDVSAYPDMQELLAASDILITDYSSSIWDFALLKRPCLLYAPDLGKYEEDNGGFYTPIREWPGILCRDEAELAEAIASLNERECAGRAQMHLETFGSYERGHACERTERVIRHFVRTGELP